MSEDNQIEDKFKELSEKVKNSTANPDLKISDDVKLSFYMYYKQATVGDCNTPQPGMFDFKKKTLWNAWNSLQGMSKLDAMKMYIYYAEQYV